MCNGHAVLMMLEDPEAVRGETIEAGAFHIDSLDHAHLCLDHAPSTQP